MLSLTRRVPAENRMKTYVKTMNDLQDKPSSRSNSFLNDITNNGQNSSSNTLASIRSKLDKFSRTAKIELRNSKSRNESRGSFRGNFSKNDHNRSPVAKTLKAYQKEDKSPMRFRDDLNSYQKLIDFSKNGKVSEKHDPAITKAFSNKIIESYLLDADKASDYIFKKEIGHGAYAKVKSAIHNSSKQEFAIKIYEKSKLSDIHRKNNVRREISLLKNMSHPNIMKLYRAFEDFSNIYLVQELIKGRSLLAYIKSDCKRRISEVEAREIISPIVSAIHYFHSIKIIHRDLKLDNILLDESSQKKIPKIIDFGFAIQMGSNKKLNIFCGTPSYMAPEIIAKREYHGEAADIWALGIIIYYLLNGDFPFKGSNERELFRKISNGNFNMPNNFSKRASEVISKILKVAPNERITIRNVIC